MFSSFNLQRIHCWDQLGLNSTFPVRRTGTQLRAQKKPSPCPTQSRLGPSSPSDQELPTHLEKIGQRPGCRRELLCARVRTCSLLGGLVLGPPGWGRPVSVWVSRVPPAPDSSLPASRLRGAWGHWLTYCTLWQGVPQPRVPLVPRLLTPRQMTRGQAPPTPSPRRRIPGPVSRLIQKEGGLFLPTQPGAWTILIKATQTPASSALGPQQRWPTRPEGTSGHSE